MSIALITIARSTLKTRQASLKVSSRNQPILEKRTKRYTLLEQRPGRRGHYTWSYQTTFGELTDPIALDLLGIAKAIFLTDRAFPRSFGWVVKPRRLRVVIPVRKVRLWLVGILAGAGNLVHLLLVAAIVVLIAKLIRSRA